MQKRKLFILFTFILFITSFFLSAIAPVRGADSSVISGANLNINYTGLPNSDLFVKETGNRRLLRYQTLAPTDLGNNQYQLNALFTFGYSTQFYTVIKANNLFVTEPGFYKENQVTYASIQTCEEQWKWWTYSSIYDYNFSYTEYDLTKARLNPLIDQLDMRLTVDATYTPSASYCYNLDKQEFSLTTTPLIATTQKIAVMNSSINPIAPYNDIVYTNTMTNIAKISDLTVTGYGSFTQEINDRLSGLGFEPVLNHVYNGELSSLFEDSYKIQGIPYHAKQQAPSVGQDDVLTNTIQVALQPDISLIKQEYNTHVGGFMLVDTYAGLFDADPGVVQGPTLRSDYAKTRTIGWHVGNYNIMFDGEVTVKISTIADFQVAEEYENRLNLPLVQLSNMYWNAIVSGEGFDVTVKNDPLTYWWSTNWFGVVIALIAVAGVAIIIIVIYLKMKGFGGLGGSKIWNINIGNRK